MDTERGTRPLQDPTIVFCSNKTARRYQFQLGPQGHKPRAACVLILPLQGDLQSQKGFFSVLEGSHLLKHPQPQALETLQPTSIMVPEKDVLVLDSRLWIQLDPDREMECTFVIAGLSLDISSFGEQCKDYGWERYVFPPMRYCPNPNLYVDLHNQADPPPLVGEPQGDLAQIIDEAEDAENREALHEATTTIQSAEKALESTLAFLANDQTKHIIWEICTHPEPQRAFFFLSRSHKSYEFLLLHLLQVQRETRRYLREKPIPKLSTWEIDWFRQYCDTYRLPKEQTGHILRRGRRLDAIKRQVNEAGVQLTLLSIYIQITPLSILALKKFIKLLEDSDCFREATNRKLEQLWHRYERKLDVLLCMFHLFLLFLKWTDQFKGFWNVSVRTAHCTAMINDSNHHYLKIMIPPPHSHDNQCNLYSSKTCIQREPGLNDGPASWRMLVKQ